MAKTSAADTDRPLPGARPTQAASAGALRLAAGEPVRELPAMVELIGFDDGIAEEAPAMPPPPGRWPPWRSFLAQGRPGGSAVPASPAELPAGDIPGLVEPTAATVRERAAEPKAARKPLRERVAPVLAYRPRLSMPAVRLPAWRVPRLRIVAACAVAAAIILLAAAILGRIGPFAPSHTPTGSSTPAAAAPPPDGMPADRVAFYQKAADSGNSEAQLQLAILHAKGEGVPQDFTVAAKWFRAAAEQGSARAQYDLGVLYERGRGVPVDLTEAAKWYLKAAEAKYPLAQYNIAVCYTKGQGIRKDLAEAAVWYRRSALQGTIQAMVNLGTMYDRGDGMPASQVDAYAWYRAAARRGDQLGAKRAEEVFATLPKLDQIRAEALAGDVSDSIRDATLDSPASAVAPQPKTTSAAAR